MPGDSKTSRSRPADAISRPVSRGEIEEIVKTVVTTMHGDLTPGDLKLYQELEALIGYIHNAKKEIAALCPDEIREKHIRSATDELDAIVAHTEEATSSILDAAESIEAVAAALEGEQGQGLTDAVTRIYEACNFQDITGQRISKIVTTLKTIETRIQSLAAALGHGHPDGDSGTKPADGADKGKKAKPDDAALLNGPQLPANARNQDEIDALLKGTG
ncbi:MAG: protein phosphatase CheZ [Alphaproteobacteria bacterium]